MTRANLCQTDAHGSKDTANEARQTSKPEFSVNRETWKETICRNRSYQIHTVEIIGKLSQGLCLFPRQTSNYMPWANSDHPPDVSYLEVADDNDCS